MSEFVQYTLEDGTKVTFEVDDELAPATSQSDPQCPPGQLSTPRSGREQQPPPPEGKQQIREGGPLADQLASVAAAADQVASGLRDELRPDEIELTFGVKISGGVNWWVFGKADGEASIQVKATWSTPKPPPPAPGDPQSAADLEPAPVFAPDGS